MSRELDLAMLAACTVVRGQGRGARREADVSKSSVTSIARELHKSDDDTTRVTLDYNELSDVSKLGLKQMTTLSVAHNKISKLRVSSRCASLRSLDVSFNRVRHVALGGVGSSLRALVLTNNKLKSLEWLADLPTLNVLVVRSNRLASLDGVQHCERLETLSASDNKLTDDGCHRFVRQLSSLKQLRLNSNQLSSIPRRMSSANTLLVSVFYC